MITLAICRCDFCGEEASDKRRCVAGPCAVICEVCVVACFEQLHGPVADIAVVENGEVGASHQLVLSPQQIRSLLVAKNVSQAAIAEYLNVSTNAVSAVIQGKLRSIRIQAEIEKAIGAKAFQKSLRPGRPKVKWTGQPGVPA